MKLVEILKNEIFEDQPFEIQKVRFHRKSKALDFILHAEESLKYDAYMKLISKLQEIFSSYRLVKLEIIYTYPLSKAEDYLEYLTHILEQLIARSARFKTLDIDDVKIDGNHIEFMVPYDALGVEDLCAPIVKEFKKMGIDVRVAICKDEQKSVQKEIEKIEQDLYDTLNKQKLEAEAAQKLNVQLQNEKKIIGELFLPL